MVVGLVELWLELGHVERQSIEREQLMLVIEGESLSASGFLKFDEIVRHYTDSKMTYPQQLFCGPTSYTQAQKLVFVSDSVNSNDAKFEQRTAVWVARLSRERRIFQVRTALSHTSLCKPNSKLAA